MTGDETIALRVTAIGGQRYADDFQVIWRDLPIGRITKSRGAPVCAALTGKARCSSN
jgi:hypothetical protein